VWSRLGRGPPQRVEKGKSLAMGCWGTFKNRLGLPDFEGKAFHIVDRVGNGQDANPIG
jgi:hypothetical protein